MPNLQAEISSRKQAPASRHRASSPSIRLRGTVKDVTRAVEDQTPGCDGLPTGTSRAMLLLHAVKANFLVLMVIAIGAFIVFSYAKASRVQKRVLARWHALPSPTRNSHLITDPRMHSQAFWDVMHASGLSHGDPPEKFINVFGKPDLVKPVQWFCYAQAGVEGVGNGQKVWVVYPEGETPYGVTVKRLPAKMYVWKGDKYYYPWPEGY